jgi:hypothetical protein
MMGTPRTNKYRTGEYTEGKFLICDNNTRWVVFEMGEFEGEPLEYDAQCLTDIDHPDFATLRDARAWCKQQLAAVAG